MTNFINPQSTCKLLNVDISKDNKHQYSFTDNVNQTNFFLSKSILKDFTKLTFIQDGQITVEGNLYSLYNANYLMFKNSGFSNKWFYAFITDMKYINQNTTLIFYELDVFQTWYFEINYKESFIERKHVTDDTIGANTIPENLNLGDYICNKREKAFYGSNFIIVLGTTVDFDLERVDGNVYNNLYSGLCYTFFRNTKQDILKLNAFIHNITNKFGAESIVCLFTAPEKFVEEFNDTNLIPESQSVFSRYINIKDGSIHNTDLDLTTNKLDNYEPKNNKLMCFPFRYLLVSNNSGNDAVYYYENFYTKNENNEKILNEPRFTMQGCITPGCSIRLFPNDYKNIHSYYDEALPLGKFPILNWNNDYYQNWLRLNSVNVGVGVAGGLAQIGVGYATGNPLTTTFGLQGIANSLAESHKASLIPPQVNGNINSGDVVTASLTNDFFFYDMSIKEEYAKIIDDYFSCYRL